MHRTEFPPFAKNAKGGAPGVEGWAGPHSETGVFAKYAALVSSAAEGAITTPARLSHSRP